MDVVRHVRTAVAVLVTTGLAALALVAGAAPAAAQEPVPDPAREAAALGVDFTRVPDAARPWLPLIGELTGTACAELPAVWVVAQAQAESGWDPGRVAGQAGGPAGLFQFDRANWVAAGGEDWSADPPVPGDAVLDPGEHLRVAVPWLCTTLRAATRYLQATGRTADPLDAMLVCHIAGCGRVADSATGVPETGEAGCGERCADAVRRYLDAVHAGVERFSSAAPAPPPGAAADAPPAPQGVPEALAAFVAIPPAWTGGGTGCDEPDPTGPDGCLTGATAHGLSVSSVAFGGIPGPMVREAGCWDRHAWNPRSDHPRGRACDLFPGEAGAFAEGEALTEGWRVADWLRANSGRLEVGYLIWQGRYWAPDVADRDGGWGRRYTGGGIYDPGNATGGHYDHIHVSFRE